MNKFYDRQQETARLMEVMRQSYEDYSRFVVLTGRRRVGKTSLVNHLMQENQATAPGLYFSLEEKRSRIGKHIQR